MTSPLIIKSHCFQLYGQMMTMKQKWMMTLVKVGRAQELMTRLFRGQLAQLSILFSKSQLTSFPACGDFYWLFITLYKAEKCVSGNRVE